MVPATSLVVIKLKHSLRYKLTTAFLLITLILFALIGVFVNVILERQFKEYVINKLEKKNIEIVETLESRYIDWGKKWNADGIENLGVSTLGDALMLRISDINGTVIWDAMTHNSGMCATIIQNMAENMQGRNGFEGGYVEKSYQVMVDDAVVGNVSIGYYGPYYYNR